MSIWPHWNWICVLYLAHNHVSVIRLKQADSNGILIKKHLQFLEVFISVKSLHFLPTFCNSAVWKNSLMILYLSKFPDKSIFCYWQLAFTKINLWITKSGNKQLLFFQNKKNNNWVEVSLSQTNCTSPMSTLTLKSKYIDVYLLS